jgi:hypothetical protein
MEKKQRGGPRPNSGRPPKIQEVKLIEAMDRICVPEKIWEALLYKCQEGDTAALKLWLSYRFGMPKQQIDVTTNGENIAPPIQWISKNISIESANVISEEISGDLQTGQQIETFGADPQTDKLSSQLDMWLK